MGSFQDKGNTWQTLKSADATDKDNTLTINSTNVTIADSVKDFTNKQGVNGWEYGYYRRDETLFIQEV